MDRIPQDKIPTNKIPQDRIPQDKIPQPEKWTKSHNIESWQWDGFKLLWWTGFIDKLYCVALAWKGSLIISARCTSLGSSDVYSQPTVRLESTCSWCPQPPCFPPELWNVHEATVNGAPRTNNQCEGWNSVMPPSRLSLSRLPPSRFQWAVIQWADRPLSR